MSPAGTVIAPAGAVAGPLRIELLPHTWAGGAVGKLADEAEATVVVVVATDVVVVGAAVVVVVGPTVVVVVATGLFASADVDEMKGAVSEVANKTNAAIRGRERDEEDEVACVFAGIFMPMPVLVGALGVARSHRQAVQQP